MGTPVISAVWFGNEKPMKCVSWHVGKMTATVGRACYQHLVALPLTHVQKAQHCPIYHIALDFYFTESLLAYRGTY